MDRRTLQAYDNAPESFATEWGGQAPPADMYELLRQFFVAGPTADIGCGSGRDTAWLNENGFPAVGYDASAGLLAVARRLHPTVRFEQAALPELVGLEDACFTNVLCETVIMHLPPGDIGASVRRLVSILQPGGTLYLSWRVTDGPEHRDDLGRLYSSFAPQLVADALSGASVLEEGTVASASSGRTVHRIVARKIPDR